MLQPHIIHAQLSLTGDHWSVRETSLCPLSTSPDFGGIMLKHKTYRLSAAAIGALAVGSFAIGAFAIGALAIGRLAIGRLAVRKGSLASLEVAELNLGRVLVDELVVRDKALTAPAGGPQLAEPFRREGI